MSSFPIHDPYYGCVDDEGHLLDKMDERALFSAFIAIITVWAMAFLLTVV
jgi:hypothetical protein